MLDRWQTMADTSSAMQKSTPTLEQNLARVGPVRLNPDHQVLLAKLMDKLELDAAEVLRKGLRRLAELEGLTSPNHRPKRSSRSN